MHKVWTTEGIRPSEQFNYWRDAVCGAFVPLEPEGCDGQFNGRIESIEGQSLTVSSVAADGHPVFLTPRGVNKQSDTCFFANLLVYGSINVEQFGRQGMVNTGDLYLLDTASPFSVTFTSPFKILCVTLEETVLRPRLGSGGQPMNTILRGDRGTGRLTAQYIQNILASDPEAVLDIEDLASVHLASLIGRAAVAKSDDDRHGPGSAARNHLSMERIRTFIDAHLAEPSLSAVSVSEALNMSRSHLYAVMADAGETFSNYVRVRRLEECRKNIQTMPTKTIAEIAYGWGFQDQSSFTRMFKNRFGVTPRQARSKAGND